MVQIKGSIWNSVWTPEFHLKKVKEHISRNIVSITEKMRSVVQIFSVITNIKLRLRNLDILYRDIIIYIENNNTIMFKLRHDSDEEKIISSMIIVQRIFNKNKLLKNSEIIKFKNVFVYLFNHHSIRQWSMTSDSSWRSSDNMIPLTIQLILNLF